MSYIFHTFFYQPILNLVVFLYNILPGHDLGVVIIVLTALIKLLLLPLSKQSIKAQKSLQDLQPKIDNLKKEYADNKEEMGKAMLELYKNNKVNPFSSCLPLLIQLPFLIAVYRVFAIGFANGALDMVYPFITRPAVINTMSFGFLDLSKRNIALAILAGLAQFWQAKMMMSKKPAVKSASSQDENMMAIMNQQMTYVMPALTVFIGITLPGGLTLYWFVTTLLTALQQLYIFKHKDKDEVKVIEGEIVK